MLIDREYKHVPNIEREKQTMTTKEYEKAKGHRDNKIDMVRDAWLRGFTLDQRVRLGLQREWFERTKRERNKP
jgi:hypothetical protein